MYFPENYYSVVFLSFLSVFLRRVLTWFTKSCTSEYDQEKEFGVDPFDEQIGIVWPVVDKSKWVVSERDRVKNNKIN
ncbi:unnamed protein product [Meloidogyne enterolobii]|uniref:Uncharacterized protein n=1 Tax=Meloidogyne enterolobii TaxID=390850 RepID=A0ACB0YEI2_MELEN